MGKRFSLGRSWGGGRGGGWEERSSTHTTHKIHSFDVCEPQVVFLLPLVAKFGLPLII